MVLKETVGDPAASWLAEGFDLGSEASLQVQLGGENMWLFAGYPGCRTLWRTDS